MKPKIHSIDVIRTISILAVLIIHTTTKVLEATQYDLITFWPTLLLNQIARFAVPLFFLISGLVLELNYGAGLNYRVYIKKRFSKIFVPYIFWSLIYYYFIYPTNPDNLLTAFLTGNASYQLYFIPTICIFYLLFPILHKFYKVYANTLILTIITYLEVQLMNRDYLIHQFNYADPIRILLLGYLYFILGIVAARNKDFILKLAGKIKYLLIPAVPYLIQHIFYEGKSRYYLTYNIGSFYSQWRPDILVYTVIIGILLFYYIKEGNFITNLLSRISKLSYLVFFVHVIILEEVWRYTLMHLFIQIPKIAPAIFLFDLLFFISVTALSFGVSYLIHKVPHLRRLTG